MWAGILADAAISSASRISTLIPTREPPCCGTGNGLKFHNGCWSRAIFLTFYVLLHFLRADDRLFQTVYFAWLIRSRIPDPGFARETVHRYTGEIAMERHRGFTRTRTEVEAHVYVVEPSQRIT